MRSRKHQSLSQNESTPSVNGPLVKSTKVGYHINKKMKGYLFFIVMILYIVLKSLWFQRVLLFNYIGSLFLRRVPTPLSSTVSPTLFSEERSLKHVYQLSEVIGSRELGIFLIKMNDSQGTINNDYLSTEYILNEINKLKKEASRNYWRMNVDVFTFPSFWIVIGPKRKRWNYL